jgi:hypothetical protein
MATDTPYTPRRVGQDNAGYLPIVLLSVSLSFRIDDAASVRREVECDLRHIGTDRSRSGRSRSCYVLCGRTYRY